MRKGYASNYIINGAELITNSVVIVEDGVLIEILPLSREYPLTKFYDGALIIVPEKETSVNNNQILKPGERIALMQLFNYSECKDDITKERYKTRKVSD